MNVVEVDGLAKSYGSIEALRGVSFTVAEGEVLAILGPNGAGKTTLIEVLEGFRKRDGGRVSVLGVDPAHGGRVLREQIGIVLQASGIDGFLSPREMLQMHAEYYDKPLSVDAVLELVGLTEKAKAKVKTLSGGQLRRLDVGLGLIGDPSLLFLDEPTTGFDPTARRQAWSVIKSLRALGKTVILTTHYMDEAQNLADRVLVVSSGRIVAEGPPESIGGRAGAPVHIRFLLPAAASVGELPVPAMLDAEGEVVVETHDPTTVLHELTGWALARSTTLQDLTVDRPSLEDIYLELTGDGTSPAAAPSPS